jgi:uncharacterized protein YxjI
MQENEIFTLQNKLLSIHKSFHGTSPDGKADFEVKGKFKLMGSKSVVTFKNASDGKEIELEVRGDWLDRKAEITIDGRPVASVSRKFFNAREFFGDKQTVRVLVSSANWNRNSSSLVFRRCCAQCRSEPHRCSMCVS